MPVKWQISADFLGGKEGFGRDVLGDIAQA